MQRDWAAARVAASALGVVTEGRTHGRPSFALTTRLSALTAPGAAWRGTGPAHCGSPGRERVALATVAGRSLSCDVGDMDADAGALVSAAVRQTMRGGAKFTLACRIAVPGYDADDRYVGLVDFDHDRCRLDLLADPVARAAVRERGAGDRAGWR